MLKTRKLHYIVYTYGLLIKAEKSISIFKIIVYVYIVCRQIKPEIGHNPGC